MSETRTNTDQGPTASSKGTHLDSCETPYLFLMRNQAILKAVIILFFPSPYISFTKYIL